MVFRLLKVVYDNEKYAEHLLYYNKNLSEAIYIKIYQKVKHLFEFYSNNFLKIFVRKPFIR